MEGGQIVPFGGERFDGFRSFENFEPRTQVIISAAVLVLMLGVAIAFTVSPG